MHRVGGMGEAKSWLHELCRLLPGANLGRRALAGVVYVIILGEWSVLMKQPESRSS